MIKLMVIGNLGRDAEMKSINGKNYISYSVANTERDKTTWIDVMQFTKDANPAVLKYLTKGSKVYVEGNPSVNAYKNKNDEVKASLSLWTFGVELVGKGEVANNSSPAPEQNDNPF